MSKLLSVIALMTTLCFNNQLCANDGLRSITFNGTTSQFIYTTPHGWIRDTSELESIEDEPIYKFVSNDGKIECFINFISYKESANITKDNLITEVASLNRTVYGDQFLNKTDCHKYSYFDAKDDYACLVIKYEMNGQKGQMLEYIAKTTSGTSTGAICILIKNNQESIDFNQEFEILEGFLKNISFI